MVYLSRDYIGELETSQAPIVAPDFTSLPRDPNELFAAWFMEAVEAGMLDVSATAVATVDKHGHPDARIMDLLHLDSDGFHFGTGKNTAKVQQLENTWAAALTFWWQPLRRSVRVKGTAHRKVDGERFNLWCVKPHHFEFFHLWEDRLKTDRVVYQRDDADFWDRIRIMDN